MRRPILLVVPILLVAAVATAVLSRSPDGEGQLSGAIAQADCRKQDTEEVRRESLKERGGEAGGRDGQEAAQGEEGAREEIARDACSLQEPSDVQLTRQLFGNKTGVTPPDVFPAARRASARIAADTKATARAVADAEWRLEGPTDVGGRVLDIAVDPQQADTLYIATASGGVWKSVDAGRTFAPSWPANETQSIGALVQTPSGTLYAGTGETGPGGGSITYGGNGVYRSTDRGATWQNIGLRTTSRIGRILVDPANEKRILVAASGNLFKPTKDRGVYLTEDGGDTWRQVLAGANDTTGATDLASNVDGSIMFATTWDHQREPDRRRYEGTGSGLYKSTDHGRTWSRVVTPPFQGSPSIGRMGVVTGSGQDGKNIAYVSITSASGTFGGLYRSTDGGTTWTPRANVALVATTGSYVYGWWFGRLWVDPKDSDRIFVPGVSLNSSTDGGLTFESDSQPHADHHAMIWDPKVPNRVYDGNDGGLYRSDRNGEPGTWTKAKYLPASQPYTIDVSEQDPSRKVAGLQDNGSVRSWGQKDGSWFDYTGGDGQRTLIKPTDKETIYGCYQYGECLVSHDGGKTGETFTNSVVSSRKNWTTPIEFDPEDPNTIYTGGEILSRSEDEAQTFTPISPELTNGPGRESNPLFRNYGTLTTIGAPGKSKKYLYAGTDDGNLWYTPDQTDPSAWTKASDPDLPKAWVTRVEVDRSNPKVAYVTYSGFRSGEDAAYLLRTRDGGQSWDNITGNLPRAPLNDVNIIGDALFVAGDLGVFVSRDQGRTWLKVGANLPLAPIFELRYHAGSNRLYAGTFGRSIWSIDLDDLGRVPAEGRPAAPIQGTSPFAEALKKKAKARRANLGLPSNKRCRVDGRSLRFRLRRPKGVKASQVRSVVVRVNGKKRVSRFTRRASRRMSIKLRRTGRSKVRVTLRTKGGRVYYQQKTYRACKRRR